MIEPNTRLFDRYRIVGELGAGGMGRVVHAYDERLQRDVAIKVLRTDGQDPTAAPRLLREAQAAAGLSHPHIVAIYDVGEREGAPYIVMELVVGAPLRTQIGVPSVSVALRIRWLTELARALAAAHERGLVHRDVKPENVMIGADGRVKVLDFGIAKSDAPLTPLAPAAPPHPGQFTLEGHVVGTPRYMAPEQLRGDRVDARSDQYAWGVLAYELLTGVHPEDTLAPTDVRIAAGSEVLAPEGVTRRAADRRRSARAFPADVMRAEPLRRQSRGWSWWRRPASLE